MENILSKLIKNGESETVEIRSQKVKKKAVLVIQVDPFPIKPVGYKGKYYKRIANSNHQMTPGEISDMHLQSLQLSWDSYPATDTFLSDLDTVKIDKFFEKVNESGRFRLTGTQEENLYKLNFIKDGKPVNAAKLLFSKEQALYNIHIGRFKTPSMILDDKMIKATLFEAVEETMFYILSHIKVAFEFTGEIERTEIFEYPKSALRELVLNAIVHRDYTSPLDIQIKIFDQSITIYNPGRLFGNLTIEQLKTDSYQSNARNKLIAEAFYLTNDIEKYGSGYLRVRDVIKEYSTMIFEYEESGNGYLVTLSYKDQKISNVSKVDEATPKNSDLTPKNSDLTPKNSDLTPKNGKSTTKKGVSDIQVLELIKENNKITKEHIALNLGITVNAVKYHLKTLKKNKLLIWEGAPRSGNWKILK